MSSNNRKLKYSLAINEALHQAMAADDSVMLIGQGVKSPWYVGNTCNGLLEKFGTERIIDTPVSENAMTGAAIGAALAGMKAITVHPRMDFMLYAFDPIINQAANWSYMNGGRLSVPVVIWGIINRGGEQAAQHSQALHGLFAHIPGLKVVLPSTPTDAKGLLISAIRDPNPVIFIDDRWLYDQEEPVPEEPFESKIGQAAIRRRGGDVTIISASYMTVQALKAAHQLQNLSIAAEVIDLRSLRPLDEQTILKSVQKTGRALIVDGGWRSFGVSGEIAALIAEKAFKYLNSPVMRIALPDIPAPANSELEAAFYRDESHIAAAAQKLLSKT